MKENIVQIKGQVEWTAWRNKRTGNWLAICEPMKLTLQASTYGELMESIAESLELVLKDLHRAGQLRTFLRQQGWKMLGDLPENHRRNARFDIPWEMKHVRRFDQQEILCRQAA